MSRHMFFGGNTPNGFYDGFSDILFLDEAKKIIYLKGSSGSGKSTLMKKVAAYYEEKGMIVDYIHCSNSIGDLDGICIRKLGFCMVDATAPHVCDPTVPIAIDEIFNLADYIERDSVKKHASELLKLQQQKKSYYVKAYNYLNAANTIYSNNIYIYHQSLNEVKLKKAIETEIKSLLKENISDRPGRNRKLFTSAISPQGMVNYLDSLLGGMTIVALNGENGMGMEQMLTAVMDTANSRGYDTESCMCTLNQDKIDHLLIPNQNLAYVTLNTYHKIEHTADRVVDFKEFCNVDWLSSYEEELNNNKNMFEELLEKSMKMMDDQKVIHDQIEKIYVPSMDFAGVDRAFNTIIKIFETS